MQESPVPSAPLAWGATGTCILCGQLYPLSEMLNYAGSFVCAPCKPLFLQRLQEGQGITTALAYAGFWIRFVAAVIDSVLLHLIQMPLWFLVGRSPFEQPSDPALVLKDPWGYMAPTLLITALSVPITVAYQTGFVGRFGATPGKMALGLRVVKADGGKLSYLHAFGRTMAEWLNSFTCTIGYIIAGFDAEKRALHDHIAGTRVIRAR